jgi:hypothetical protein
MRKAKSQAHSLALPCCTLALSTRGSSSELCTLLVFVVPAKQTDFSHKVQACAVR